MIGWKREMYFVQNNHRGIISIFSLSFKVSLLNDDDHSFSTLLFLTIDLDFDIRGNSMNKNGDKAVEITRLFDD